VMGLSVQRAAQDLKRQLLRHGAGVLKAMPDRLGLKHGRIEDNKGQGISFESLLHKIFSSKAGEIVGRGAYQDIKSKKAALGSPTTFWEISWGGAEVEVDRDTGEIKLIKYVSLADVGQAIHPVLCEGQDEGGVMNALGHSLLEEMVYRDGQLLNPNLVDYRVPTFNDLPMGFKTILVENHNGPGPFGAKGTGEGGLLPVAPAIGNALYKATGVRLYQLPLTPERVWQGLQAKNQSGNKAEIARRTSQETGGESLPFKQIEN
jgi:CO/xanthine dehydrogenase Mo-binding subunit